MTRLSHRGLPARGVPLAYGLALGVLADQLFGDPRRGHPVAGFGQLAFALERRTYADSRVVGALHTASLVAGAVGAGALLSQLGRRSAGVTILSTAATTWTVVGARSLQREARTISGQLRRGHLEAARLQVRNLVGRETAGLSADEIARATVESLAENTADAVVAPLFWGAVAGVPGLLGYRAINTLDAMIGHHSTRYEHFGWAAARLDDAANWVPARLTGLLTLALALREQRSIRGASTVPPVDGRMDGLDQHEGRKGAQVGGAEGRPTEPDAPAGGAAAAWRAWRRDAPAHPSPNAGVVEATFAGALGIRLGGRNVYHGVVEDRGTLGDGRPVEVADIDRAARLAARLTLAATAMAFGMALAGARPR